MLLFINFHYCHHSIKRNKKLTWVSLCKWEYSLPLTKRKNIMFSKVRSDQLQPCNFPLQLGTHIPKYSLILDNHTTRPGLGEKIWWVSQAKNWLKGFRTGLPKMGPLGLGIILTCRQLRNFCSTLNYLEESKLESLPIIKVITRNNFFMTYIYGKANI